MKRTGPSSESGRLSERRRNERLVKAASWLVIALVIVLAVLLALLALRP